MKIIHSQKDIESLALKPFTPIFNQIFLSFDEDCIENGNEDYDRNIKLTEKNIKQIFDLINYSWDGDIYWFKKEDKEQVLTILSQWFAKEENHSDLDDFGIANCFLIKDTPNGIALIDTQLDMSSTIDSFFNELKNVNPNITYEYYSDSHLIDNLHLGRDSSDTEFEDLYFLYKENVIDSSFFILGLSSIDISDNNSVYHNLIPKDKSIAITGKMSISRDDINSVLEDANIITTEKIDSNTWLWTGEKVGEEKLAKAKLKGAKISSIDEVISDAFERYKVNKNNLNKKKTI